MSEQANTIDSSRWALVTGASAGIGREFCRQLAARGFHLVLIARRADLLHALAAELRERHGTASLVIPADLSQRDAARKICRRLDEEEIVVQFLINNAGYGVPGRFTDPDWQSHADFIQVMITTACEPTWRLLPGMQNRGEGYVVNVASVAGLTPGSEGHTLYGASKSFLIRFSQSLALENRRHGVAVTALCPGFTYTEFHDVTGTRSLVNRLPDFMWLHAPDVVRYGLDSVTRKPPRVVAIPGFFYRLLVGLNRYLPGFGNWTIKRLSRRFRYLK